MATLNSTIMKSAWLSAGNDFQQRVPDPTQHSLAEVNACLFDPMNNDLYNQWSSALINRIGMTIFNDKRFTNPLAIFRRPDMQFGHTVQNIAVKWAKAHSYGDDTETLLAYARPDFVASYVSIDRYDRYDVSVTRNEMRQAVASDGYGMNQLLNLALSSVVNAEAYDEMNIMINLLAQHEAKHGVFKVNLSAAPTDKETAQEMLSAVKTYVNRLQFPSTLYNAQDVDGVPTFANADELVLLVTPSTMANLDVYAFADLFNVDRAEVRTRIVMVPEFATPNTCAILTTYDAFICARSEFGMYDFFNPETLTTKTYLHAQGAYGINPFCPMLKFTTETATTPVTAVFTPTGVDITPATATMSAGEEKQLTVAMQGSWSNGAGLEVEPDAVTWTIEATAGTPELNSRTYVDRFNVLHLQKSGLTAGDKITLTGTSTYQNPSGATSAYTDTVVITIA